MAAKSEITIRVSFAWWLKPYMALSRFGWWLDLPLNTDTIAKDIIRSMKVKVLNEHPDRNPLLGP